jgi:hypothetical protein
MGMFGSWHSLLYQHLQTRGHASGAVARLGSGQPAHPSSTPSESEFRVFSPGELPV